MRGMDENLRIGKFEVISFFGIIFLLENVHLVVITKNFADRWCAFLPMKKDYVNN